MKIICKIARAELRNLFYSPIAWLVLLAFYITAAGMLMFSLAEHANIQEVAQKFDPAWVGFDGKGVQGFSFGLTIFKMYEYVYLFIPLLTMGLINREITNGTSKLLYSSPVTTSEIVWGKFLGMAVFNLLILCLLALTLYSFSLTIQVADFNWILSILLGFFLVMNAYAAIGLFLSSITNYPIVAAILTFVVFYVLSVITRIGQQYDLIRDITYALSMGGKGTMMLFGLITSRDVIYFLLIIFLFVAFTIFKLDSTQQSGSKLKNIARYGISVLIVIVVGYFSSRPKHVAYLDVTNNKSMTIPPVVQDAIKTMDGSPLTVTLYTNLLGENAAAGLPQARILYLMEFWEPYTRFYPNTIFKYEYYYDLMDGDSSYYRKYPGKNIDEIAAIEAEIFGIRTSLFKKPDEIRKLINLDDEKTFLVMQLEYKGKKSFLRTYRGGYPWPEQQHVAASVMRLTRDKEVKATFATGHFERDAFDNTSRDYQDHTTEKHSKISLINNGVDVDTISFLTGNMQPGADMLVLADPKTDYSAAEQAKIISWINSGGNAIILTEPGKQAILAPVLKEIGVYPEDGIIVRPDKHHTPILFKEIPVTRAGNFLAKERPMQLFQEHGYRGGKVTQDGVVNLDYTETKGFKIEPIVTLPGNDSIWIEKGKLVVDSAAPVFAAGEGDTRKPEYTTALKLTRSINGKEQRIIVSGDADFMSQSRGRGIGLALYSFTLNNAYPLYANRPLPQDRYIKISSVTAKGLAKLFVFGISGAILLTAIILLVRRKRK